MSTSYIVLGSFFYTYKIDRYQDTSTTIPYSLMKEINKKELDDLSNPWEVFNHKIVECGLDNTRHHLETIEYITKVLDENGYYLQGEVEIYDLLNIRNISKIRVEDNEVIEYTGHVEWERY